MINNTLAKRFSLPDPLLLGLLALATLLSCAFQRAAFPFWSDEAYTVLAVRARDWTEFLALNLRNEETPPLYFALLRLWALAWGDSSESTLRLFSAVCLAATVPLVGLLGTRLWNRQVGLVAALLLVVNPFARYYGQEARAYTLTMLFIGIFILGAYGYARQPGPRPWVGYILGGIAALYTHYFAAFVLAGVSGVVGLALLADALRTRTRAGWAALGGWVLAQMLILVALSAWIPGIRYQFTTRTQGPEERSGPLQFVLSLIALGSALPDGSILALALVLIVALALAIALTIVVARGTLEQRLFILGAIALPAVCVVLMLRNESQFSARYIIFSMSGYVLLLAAGLLHPWRWQRLTRTLLVLLLALSAAYALSMARDSRRRGGWDAMARTVEQQAQATDAVFFAPPYTRAAFEIQYHGRPLPMFGADSFAQYYYERDRQLNFPIDADALQTQLGQGRRAWIVWDRTYIRDLPTLKNVQSQEFVFGSTTLVLVTPAEATAALVCAQEASLCKK